MKYDPWPCWLPEPYLDFDTIESGELSLEGTARKDIYLACEDFLSSARMFYYAPSFDAEGSRNKSRDLCKKATAAKKALSDLSVCSYDAVLHDFYLFTPEEGNVYISKVKYAIRLARKIAERAEKRSLELHQGGRPEFWDFKRLTAELYRTYLASGGNGKIIWDKSRKCYKGRPMFFIRRVIGQIRPLVPETVVKKFLPERDCALSRTTAEAIRKSEKREAKMWGKRGQKWPYFCLPRNSTPRATR